MGSRCWNGDTLIHLYLSPRQFVKIYGDWHLENHCHRDSCSEDMRLTLESDRSDRSDGERYGLVFSTKKWWLNPDLNWGHADFQSAALPTELFSHGCHFRQGHVFNAVPIALTSQNRRNVSIFIHRVNGCHLFHLSCASILSMIRRFELFVKR